jgi:hypothetical protein
MAFAGGASAADAMDAARVEGRHELEDARAAGHVELERLPDRPCDEMTSPPSQAWIPTLRPAKRLPRKGRAAVRVLSWLDDRHRRDPD